MTEGSSSSAADWIGLLITRARDLRAAGVTEVAVDGCAAKLLPPDPPELKIEEDESDKPRPFRRYSAEGER